GLNKDIDETLHRINIRKKYSATLLSETPDNEKLLKKIRNNVAYGKIDEKTLKELIDKRGKPLSKESKIDSEKVIAGLGKKSLIDLGIKPFFSLHSPRGGIESKKHFGVGKGVLADNGEKINDLVRRML